LSARRHLRPRTLWLLGLTLILAALVTAIPLGARTAAAQTPETIAGRVVNGTAGGTVPERLEVVLLTLDESKAQIVGRDSTFVDEEGRFEFTGFSTGQGLTYRVAANDGLFTPSVDLANTDDWSNVELVIYDRTRTLDDLWVSSYSLLIPSIDARSRVMGVLGAIDIRNEGDTVWLPELNDPGLTGLDLVRFSIPEGYSNLSVESDLPAGNVMEIGTGFALSTPIPPGEFNILVSFLLAYDGDGFEFPLILPFGADQVRFMLPHAESTITGEGLGQPRTEVVNDRLFTIVEGAGFERGARLTVTVTGLPSPSFVERAVDYFGGRPYIPILAWLAGTAFLSLLAYALIRSRRRPATEAPTRRELVNAIAALDELRDAGKIEPERYTVEREALMRRALRAPEDGEPSMKDETGAAPPA
jgi:hypothetical protein